jgi:hypothetical protein
MLKKFYRFVLPSKFKLFLSKRMLIYTRGIRLYYLPPYSPDLNPIEEAFSYVKSVLRRNGSVFRAAVDSKDLSEVTLVIQEVLLTITPEKAQGWMAHSGYLSAEN